MREIRDLERAIAAQSTERNGTFPTTWAEVGMQPPLDPWGRAYVIGAPFRKDITFLNRDFDLYSTGADGLTAQDITDAQSLDDVLRAGDGGFVGSVDSILF